MDSNLSEDTGRKEKNPSLAAFLAIFPGMGAIYNGNFLKGITYVLIFQIVDSYNEAGRMNQNIAIGEESAGSKEDLSLFSAVAVLVIGIIFQLANFDLLTYRQVTRLWPLALIAFGIKIVFNYFKREGHINGKH
jgi:hypothetical protein